MLAVIPEWSQYDIRILKIYDAQLRIVVRRFAPPRNDSARYQAATIRP